MEDKFGGYMRNWKSEWKPQLLKWLTYESQQGKSQLDTHFAYINKHLTKACLSGGIDYLDPRRVLEAFRYKGGAKGTTALLAQQLPAAKILHEECESIFTQKDKEGINSVHDIDVEPTRIDHSFFANLVTGRKTFYPDSSWPSVDLSNDPIFEILERHYHDGEPLFFPFTENLAVVDGVDELKKLDPDQRLLPTRVYWALKKHTADIAFAIDDGAEGSSEKRTRQDEQVQELTRRMKIAFSLVGELVEVHDENVEFPPTLDKFWARKKNKTYFGLSTERLDELCKMFEGGQGTENRAVRMSAERATARLIDGILAYRWDQMLKCSIGKVKSYFGAKFQEEQRQNGRKKQDSWSVRKLRGKEMLLENTQAVKALLEQLSSTVDSPEISDATLKDFSKMKVGHLKAFIRCRVLTDATTLQLEKMPKKGSLKAAETDDSEEPMLIRWAHNLRDHPVIATVPDTPTQDESPEEERAREEHEIYLEAINSQREESVFEILEATEDGGPDTVEELSDDEGSWSSAASSDDDDSSASD